MRALGLAVFAATIGCVTLAQAAEKTAPDCSLKGLDLAADPDFIASLGPIENTSGFRGARACKTVSQREHAVEGVRLRLTLSDLFSDAEGEIKQRARLVDVVRIDPAGERSLARIVLPPDPLDGETRYEPQVVKKDGAILIRLAPRHHQIYRVEETRLVPVPVFDWRDQLQIDVGLRSGGQILSVDIERMEGKLALLRENAGAGGEPGATDAIDMAVASLALSDGKLAVRGTETTRPRAGEFPFIEDIVAEERDFRSGVKNIPAGVEPCSLRAWSNDPDPAGLNVRAEPNAQGRILGIVPPPRVVPKKYDAFGPEPVKAEFRVVGYRDGWFLIEGVKAPGVAYDIPYPASLPQPFKGRGWVGGNKIGAAPAYSSVPPARLYRAPHAQARFEVLSDAPDHPFSHILACSGSWGRVETERGKRGWVRTLCSDQSTNCS